MTNSFMNGWRGIFFKLLFENICGSPARGQGGRTPGKLSELLSSDAKKGSDVRSRAVTSDK
jgi:hypothetical protein